MKNLPKLAVIAAFSLALAQASFADGLVHRYSFNDGSAKDSVGQAYGRIVGGITVSDGHAKFDGTKGTRIELPADAIKINTQKAVTIEAWFTVAKPAFFQRLFDFGGSEKDNGKNYLFYSPTTVAFSDSRAVISNGPTLKDEVKATAPTVESSRETYVAVIVDATTITLYVDGTQAAQKALGTKSLAQVSNDFALIGASLYTNDPAFNGSINEFRIYDTALTAGQVKASFDAEPDKIEKSRQ